MRWAGSDWNGDGKIDRKDGVYELWMIQDIVDTMEQNERTQRERIEAQERALRESIAADEREYRISRMTKAIRDYGRDVDNDVFRDLCFEIDIPITDFEQADIDEIRRRINAPEPEE